MFGDQSIAYTWSQNWNLWDGAAIVPVYSQMRGWTNIVDGVFAGIDELLGTVDKTKRMGYENLHALQALQFAEASLRCCGFRSSCAPPTKWAASFIILSGALQ